MTRPYDEVRNIAIWETRSDPAECICRGSGWWSTPFDTWEPCPFTSHVGPHPEHDYCEDCHGYDCWRPPGYLNHPLQANDHPELVVSHPKPEWEIKLLMHEAEHKRLNATLLF